MMILLKPKIEASVQRIYKLLDSSTNGHRHKRALLYYAALIKLEEMFDTLSEIKRIADTLDEQESV